jgi:7-cyano-7-deazaguanine reductase
MNDLKTLMEPRYIEVIGIFMPRGGISIYPMANWGDDEHHDFAQKRRFDFFVKSISNDSKK